jgi:multidrug efflux pump subunit AcrB
VISGIFINRPRLAIVIAIVITIAGAIALLRIPVAQFPDIVPPRVQVSATYPGASAAVVEASVAQPSFRASAPRHWFVPPKRFSTPSMSRIPPWCSLG